MSAPTSSDDRLRDALGALDAVAVPDPVRAEAAVRERAARATRSARRRVIAASVCVVVVGAAALVWAVAPGSTTDRQLVATPAAGPDTTERSTTDFPTTASLVPTTAAGLGRIGDPPLTQPTEASSVSASTSLAFSVGDEAQRLEDGDTTVISATDGSRATVTIFDPTGVTTLELPGAPANPRDDTRPIEAGDVTGDGRADYLIPLESNGPSSTLASDDGGTWHLVPGQALEGGGTSPELGRDPHLRDGAVVIAFDDCVPSCAEGTTTEVRLIYRDGALVWPS